MADTRANLPDGYPTSVEPPYGQPAYVARRFGDGALFTLDQFAGWCGDGCGQRLNHGTTVVKRGQWMHLPDHDPSPPAVTCAGCGVEMYRLARVVPHDVCADCWPGYAALLWVIDGLREFWGPTLHFAPKGFGVMEDTTPVAPAWQATRDQLRRNERNRRVR
jgi:hypothetical protein